MLEVNDWIIINTITYKIHSISNIDDMRLAIIKQIKYLFDFDSASFYTVLSLNTSEIGHPIGINYPINEMEEYLKVFKEVDYSKGLMSTGKNIAYRESDIINDNLRIQTEYYKKVYKVHNWHHSLHLNISYNEVFLGVMSFFRNTDKPNFDYDSTFILDTIKDHLAFRLYTYLKSTQNNLLSISDSQEKYNLTNRETSILSLLIDNYDNKEICNKLLITNNTLKKHILNTYRKLDINKRIQLFDIIKKC